MKKILIFYAKYGGGHLSAAKAIQKHLDDNFEVETELIDCIQYVSKILNRVTTGAYNQMAKILLPYGARFMPILKEACLLI